MRIVIYEPDHRGHHFVHVSRVLPEISELVDEVTLVTTPTAARSQEFQVYLGPYVNKFAVDTSIGERTPISEWKHSVRGLKQIQHVARTLRPDHIYVMYGDGIAQAVGLSRLTGRRPWGRDTEAEVLLMRGGFQYPAENYRRRILNAVIPRTTAWGGWTRVHHMNPDDLAVLEKYDAPGSRRFRLMPDPVESPPTATKAEARRELGIPESGRYMGCAGGIDRRKGIDLLVRAFLAAQSELRSDDRLLLAGSAEQPMRDLLAQEASQAIRDGRIMAIDRPLTPKEFGLAFRAMDIVATPYPRHPHSASIVIHAAACGRPTLGSAIGWMDRTIRQFELGATCDVRDPAALRKAIIRMLRDPVEWQPTEAAQRFVAFHNIDNFRAHWLARLRERLKLPVDENRLDWESVTAELTAGRRLVNT